MTAPKITKLQIDEMLSASTAQYWQPEGTRVTVCCLTLPNGFGLVGHSSCVLQENFDSAIGEKVAFEHAAKQLWEFEGYRLRCELVASGS